MLKETGADDRTKLIDYRYTIYTACELRAFDNVCAIVCRN